MRLILNEAQREAVSWYFNPENKEGDLWPVDESVEIDIVDGELLINYLYLHSTGDWATYPEKLRLPS